MTTCETCGNDYDKPFKVVMKGEAFDSFECAIHALAPSCKVRHANRCGVFLIGSEGTTIKPTC
jgi:hypothetical protein